MIEKQPITPKVRVKRLSKSYRRFLRRQKEATRQGQWRK